MAGLFEVCPAIYDTRLRRLVGRFLKPDRKRRHDEDFQVQH